MLKTLRSLASVVSVVLLSLALVTPVGSAAAVADSVEMTLWVNSWGQDWINAIQKAVNLFAQQNPRVKSVKLQIVPQGEHIQKLAVAVAGGSPPDAVTLPAPYVQYTLGGLLQPLDSFLQKSQVVKRSDYPSAILDSLSVDGRLYGLPAIEVGPGMILFYHRGMFEEAGLPDRGPKTLQELYLFHQKLTRVNSVNKQVTQLGLDPRDAMGGTYFPTIWSTVFDIKYYDPTTHKLDMLSFESALEFLKRIYNTPSYAQVLEFTKASSNGWWSSLANKTKGMQINGYWLAGLVTTNKEEIGFDWMPTVANDKAMAVLPWGMAIPANAKHPDLSFQLLEFFATPEVAQILFDATGGLNGNLSSMRKLDVRKTPVTAQFIRMLDEATRVTAPVQLPILDQISSGILWGGTLDAVWKNEESTHSVLTRLQDQWQQQLDKIFSSQQARNK